MIWLFVSAMVGLLVLAWQAFRVGSPPVWLVALTLLVPLLAAQTIFSVRDELGNVRLAVEGVQFRSIEPGPIASIGSDPLHDDVLIGNVPRGLAGLAVLRRLPDSKISLTAGPDRNVIVRVNGAVLRAGASLHFCSRGPDCLLHADIEIGGNKAGPISFASAELSGGGQEAEDAEPLTLRLVFTRPQLIVLDAEEMRSEMRNAGNGPLTLKLEPANGTNRPESVSESSVPLTMLGGEFRNQLDYWVVFDRNQITVRTQAGQWPLRNGQSVAAGDKSQAIVRITRQGGDWADLNFTIWVLVLGGAGTVAATWRARTADYVGLALFLLLDFLVCARVLVSFEVAYIDNSIRAARAVPGALIALGLCPLLLNFHRAWRAGEWFTLAAQTALGLVILIAVSWQFSDIGFWGWIGGITYGLAIVALTDEAIARRRGRIGHFGFLSWSAPVGTWPSFLLRQAVAFAVARMQWMVRLFRLLPFPSSPVSSLIAGLRYRTGLSLAWFGALGALLAMRLALLAGDVAKERFTLGGAHLGVTAIYAPAALLLFAAYFRARQDFQPPTWRGRGQPWQELVFLATLAAVYFVLPYKTHDIGEVIYALPIIAMAAAFSSAGLTLPRGTRLLNVALSIVTALIGSVALYLYLESHIWGIALAGVFALAALVLILSRPVTGMILPAAMVASVLLTAYVTSSGFGGAATRLEEALDHPHSERTLEFLDQAASANRNMVRLVQYFRPQLLASFGTSQADNFRATLAHMQDYASHEYGYMKVRRPTVLARYHMDDNVSAVHLLAPFGRFGAMFFLTLEMALAVSLTLSAQRDARLDPAGRLGAVLAVWTIAMVSFYMVLANMGYVPFTGRNVYFLSVGSLSDIAEAMALLFIVRFGMERRT